MYFLFLKNGALPAPFLQILYHDGHPCHVKYALLNNIYLLNVGNLTELVIYANACYCQTYCRS